MTLKQMRDQVVNWLGLQDIDSYNETTMVGDLLYQGTIDLLSRTRCTVRCVQLRVQAGQDEYTLDHGILALVDVENGARPRLRRNQLADAIDPGFALIRSDVLLVEPTPSVDGQIQVWGVMRPQQMALDTDSPESESFGAIPTEYHDAIVSYAMWKAADYSDDAGSQQGERYRVLYEGQDGRGGRLGQIKSLVNKRGTARAASRKVTVKVLNSHDSYVG
jgi:hypothetical protein